MYVYTECWFNKCYTYGHTGKKEKNGGKETKTAGKSEESRGSPKGEYCHFMDPPPSRARKERRVRELSRGWTDLALSPMLHSESSGSSQLFSFSACNIEKLGGAWGRG